MSVETWADRRDYHGLRAAVMRCPCCGKQRTADSIVRVDGVTTVRSAARTRFRLAADLTYVCTAQLETLKRERLVTKAELPSSRVR